MRMMRLCGVVASVVLLAGGAAGCRSGDASDGGKAAKPSHSAVKKPVAPRDALEDYVAAGAAGCETAPECQDQMTAKLAAGSKVRSAMKAKDPSLYAEPIGFVDETDLYGWRVACRW
ncbi:hypothetical protein [Streptomyces sp. NPDC058695]|uniref:hypothetical protein n=1 Tax=Streptomyces sp. NPDC058695 TaxID=3346604 RepID=UPI00365AAF3C